MDGDPTDADYERSKGRVAVWLDPDDIRWLARFLAGYHPPDPDERDLAGRLRFRLMTALHKAGQPNNPWDGDITSD